MREMSITYSFIVDAQMYVGNFLLLMGQDAGGKVTKLPNIFRCLGVTQYSRQKNA